jgi:ribosomal protein L7/L12
MQFKDAFATVARLAPDLAPLTVYAIAEALAETRTLSYDPTNRESLGAFALTLPLVVQAIKDGKRIQAIKELRAATNCGLADAKYALESRAFCAVYPMDRY